MRIKNVFFSFSISYIFITIRWRQQVPENVGNYCIYPNINLLTSFQPHENTCTDMF